MTNWSIAENEILKPADLTTVQLEALLSSAMTSSADDGDIYLQTSYHQSWHLENDEVKEGSYSEDRGVGIRVVSGEKTGFAYSAEVDFKFLQQAAMTAKNIVRAGQSQQIPITKLSPSRLMYPSDNPIISLNETNQVAFLQEINNYARSLNPKVTQVEATLISAYDVVMIVTADGKLQTDFRPLVRIGVQVLAEDNGKREMGYAGGGGRGGFEILFDNGRYLEFAKEAVEQAAMKLIAEPAPAGTMPVVLGPGWPGVLLHEAVGHGLEADFNRKGSSAFTGKIGERVASNLCTVVDNGAIEGRRGSLTIDDEGTETQETVLIENGILKQYMQDKQNARLMGMQPTGNGRRESFAHLPMPRMTNTYMLAGESDPAEIIASVDHGIYATNFNGGQVDISSGKFVFSTSEAYLIKNGKIAHPIKGATLIGNGPESLKHVSMVGNDLKLDSGIGVCGKDGQSVPVGVGMPTIKLDELTVGGSV